MNTSSDYSAKDAPNKIYLANVAVMVKRSISLSNNPPLSQFDLDERARDWTAAFYGTIPFEKLVPAFEKAVELHKGTFAINAYEVLEAFKIIDAEEQAEFDYRVSRMNALPEYRRWECPKCFNTGFAMFHENGERIRRDHYTGVVKCDCGAAQRKFSRSE